MDMTTISGALSSLNIAAQFIKGSIEKIKDNAVREKVEELLNAIIPLQTHIIALNEKYSTCAKEKENLEQKLRETEDWQQEAKTYELTELASGVYAYAKKKTENITEPFHYLCTKCYNERRKSILQRTRHDFSGLHYVCPSCPLEIVDYSKALPLPKQRGGPVY